MLDLSDPKAHNWRQGSLASLQMPGLYIANYQIDPPLQDHDALLVVSHDCDICCKRREDEPAFESIPARRIAEADVDPNFLAGRSPRRLQIRMGKAEVYELRATERLMLKRELFEQSGGDIRAVSPQNLELLRRWLRRRYDRTSLPTEFLARIGRVEDVLHKKLKAHGEPVCSVWLVIRPEKELSDGEDYTVSVYFVMPVEEYEKSDRLQQTRAAAASVQAALAKCMGIASEGVMVSSEADVSLDDLRELIRWDFDDYLSYRNDNPNLTPQI